MTNYLFLWDSLSVYTHSEVSSIYAFCYILTHTCLFLSNGLCIHVYIVCFLPKAAYLLIMQITFEADDKTNTTIHIWVLPQTSFSGSIDANSTNYKRLTTSLLSQRTLLIEISLISNIKRHNEDPLHVFSKVFQVSSTRTNLNVLLYFSNHGYGCQIEFVHE